MRADAYRWFIRGAALAFGAALAYGVVLAATLAVRELLLVFIAILLGSALEPVVGAARARFGAPRGPTILLVYAAFLARVLLLALLVAPGAIGQVSLMIGSAVGGVAGGFIAVPVAAAVEAVLERLQDRELPVAQEPAHSPGERERVDGTPPPDSAGGADLH